MDLDNQRLENVISLAIKIIAKFPRAKNNEPFLTLQNGRKLFFGIFMKKYGLDGSECTYKELDVIRRIRLIEFFDYFVKDNAIEFQDLNNRRQKRYKIESAFHKMIVVDTGTLGRSKLELLSFYPTK